MRIKGISHIKNNVIKLLKTKDKEKILKADLGGQRCFETHKGAKIRITVDF